MRSYPPPSSNIRSPFRCPLSTPKPPHSADSRASGGRRHPVFVHMPPSPPPLHCHCHGGGTAARQPGPVVPPARRLPPPGQPRPYARNGPGGVCSPQPPVPLRSGLSVNAAAQCRPETWSRRTGLGLDICSAHLCRGRVVDLDKDVGRCSAGSYSGGNPIPPTPRGVPVV